MKIALVIEQIDPRRGGAERSCEEIANLMTDVGMQVSVITRWAGSGLDADFQIVDLGPARRYRRFGTRTFIRRAEAIIDERDYDIVHAITPVRNADVYQPRGGLVDEIVSRNSARRGLVLGAVRRLIGPNPKQRYIRRIERLLARHSGCVFAAVSDYVRRQCRDHLGLSDGRIRVIPNGVDIDTPATPADPARMRHLRTIFQVRDDQVIGLFVANNLKLKGIDLILAALRYLKRTDRVSLERIKIAVVTGRNFWPAYKKTRRQGLFDHMLFLGPAQDMVAVYRLGDFLVHPTWYDPSSRVVLEATACRLPSITSRYNGAGELVEHTDCGIVIGNLGDPAELADAMKTMADPASRKRFADNCEKAGDRISMARHVHELVELYKELKS